MKSDLDYGPGLWIWINYLDYLSDHGSELCIQNKDPDYYIF